MVDLRCLWDYVGRYAADDTHLLPLENCPVDSFRRTAYRHKKPKQSFPSFITENSINTAFYCRSTDINMGFYCGSVVK